MKGLLAVSFMLVCASSFASPVKPAQAELDRIQKVLDSFNAKKDETANLGARRRALEIKLGLTDAQGRPRPDEDLGAMERLKRYFLRQGKEYAEYLEVVKDDNDGRRDLNALAASAIKLTREAYKIDPNLVSGTIVSGPPIARTEDDVSGYIGRQTAFAPIFDPGLPDTRSGESRDDGTELIGPKAFAYPGKLAFTLYHEGQHFERILTPDLDLRNIPDWEVREREAQRPLLVDTFSLKRDDLEQFEAGLKRDEERAVKWNELIKGGLDPYKKSNQPAFPGNNQVRWLQDGAEDELDAIHEGTRRQRALANREHDQRLKIAIGELVRRSCDAPGSVSQGELDALSWPYDKDFCTGKFPPALQTPDGTGYCISTFLYICQNIRGHADASELSRMSTPPVTARPVQPSIPIRVVPTVPFNSMMPEMLGQAEAACRAPETVSTQSLMPAYEISFSSLDDSVEQLLLAGAGTCERAVFSRIAEFIRNGRGAALDDETVRSMAAPFRYTPPPTPPPSNSPTPGRRGKEDRDDTPRRGPDHDEVWRRVNPIIRH